MTKPKKATKPRGDLARDLEILKQHMPAELGGEGLTVEQIAEERGLSRWAIYKALERRDVREAEQAWLKFIVGSQRDLAPEALVALRELIRAGDSATVNAFFKRMGPPEPVADVAIEKLELKVPQEYLDLVHRLNPAFDEAEDGAYRCPACSYVRADIGQLGDHIQAAHCSESSAANEPDEH